MITVEHALALEHRINAVPFQGISMGGTLNQLIMTQYLFRQPSLDLWAWIRGFLSVTRKGIVPFPKATNLPMPTGCFCLTSIGTAAKYTGLIAPLIERVSSDESVLIVPSGQECNLSVRPSRRIPVSRVLDFDRASWRSSYRRVCARWRASVAGFLRNGQLPAVHSVPIEIKLALQSQRVMHFRRLLTRLRPKIVVTEYDRNDWVSPLILTARSLGIPTVTMVHGIICLPYGYTPLLADSICCWGEVQKEQLQRYGVPGDRIAVTGDPRFSPVLAADVGNLRKKLGITSAKPLVILATNPTERGVRLELAQEFATAFDSDSNCVFGLRLHASEDPAFYAPLRERFPQLKIWDNRSLSMEEAISTADVVVAHSSSFLFDAVFRGRPVIVLNPAGLKAEMDNVQDLLGSTSTLEARSASSLRQAARRVFDDGAFRERLVREYRIFRERYIACGGSEAVDRIMDCLQVAASARKGTSALL